MIALRLAECSASTRPNAGRLLHGAAGKRGLPFRRARTSQVVRRRHRPQGRQVSIRTAKPSRGRRRLCEGSAPETAAAPASGRSRVRDLRARDVNDMIARHAAWRAAWPTNSACRPRAATAVGVVRAVGRAGWPGDRAGDRSHRVAVVQLAEFAEVAHRVGGSTPRRSLARKRRYAVRPRARRALPCATPRRSSAGLDAARHVGRGDRGRAVTWRRARPGAVRRGARGDRPTSST